MVTVSVRRGGRLVVVADAWHLEHDCEWRSAGRGILFIHFVVFVFSTGHYEWHVALPPREVDLGAVRARFGEDGTLVIDVPRSIRFV